MKKDPSSTSPKKKVSGLALSIILFVIVCLAAYASRQYLEVAEDGTVPEPSPPVAVEKPVKEESEVKEEESVKEEDRDEMISQILDKFSRSGIEIHIKERFVDVDCSVALKSGFLELIACTKDSKEHESLIAVNATAHYIHTALLIIGAKSGNPAMRKLIDEENMRWIDIPPRGQNIDVFLVIKDKEGVLKERPIQDFIRKSEDEFSSASAEPGEDINFPTNTFLFAGSQMYKDKEGKQDPVYLSDESGNVISISTFGDELLCLPGIHGQDNEHLAWEANESEMPPVGTQVILRLKPQFSDSGAEDK